MIPRVPADRSDIRLPSSERSPLSVLLRRLGLAAALVVIVSIITYIDRDGFRDSSGDPIDLLDAFYFGAVSVTSTGYGDGGATDEDLSLMLKHSPAPMQVKAAGGKARASSSRCTASSGARLRSGPGTAR